MSTAKKITVNIPEELLAKAMESTGMGLTETIRQGLQLVAASEAYERLRELRGKVKFSVDLNRLRDDRNGEDHK